MAKELFMLGIRRLHVDKNAIKRIKKGRKKFDKCMHKNKVTKRSERATKKSDKTTKIMKKATRSNTVKDI